MGSFSFSSRPVNISVWFKNWEMIIVLTVQKCFCLKPIVTARSDWTGVILSQYLSFCLCSNTMLPEGHARHQGWCNIDCCFWKKNACCVQSCWRGTLSFWGLLKRRCWFIIKITSNCKLLITKSGLKVSRYGPVLRTWSICGVSDQAGWSLGRVSPSLLFSPLPSERPVVSSAFKTCTARLMSLPLFLNVPIKIVRRGGSS